MEMLLTVEQAATRLQLTPYTVRKHLQAGKLRGVKRGRVWRVPDSALTESSPAPGAGVSERLTALEALVGRGEQWTKDAPPLAPDAVAQVYAEREGAQL